jgi:uncharacterized protein DUF6894
VIGEEPYGGSKIMRFFFDYRTNNRSLFDYRGDEFQSPQGAIEYAEAIVQHLKNSLSGDWVGWSVEVRNAEGTKFHSLLVDAHPT